MLVSAWIEKLKAEGLSESEIYLIIFRAIYGKNHSDRVSGTFADLEREVGIFPEEVITARYRRSTLERAIERQDSAKKIGELFADAITLESNMDNYILVCRCLFRMMEGPFTPYQDKWHAKIRPSNPDSFNARKLDDALLWFSGHEMSEFDNLQEPMDEDKFHTLIAQAGTMARKCLVNPVDLVDALTLIAEAYVDAE